MKLSEKKKEILLIKKKVTFLPPLNMKNNNYAKKHNYAVNIQNF